MGNRHAGKLGYLSKQDADAIPDNDQLAQKAIDAVRDGRVQFFPKRYENSYLDWLSEKRDWCVSRQLWWGHRIPVWDKLVYAPGIKKLAGRKAPFNTEQDPRYVQLRDEFIKLTGVKLRDRAGVWDQYRYDKEKKSIEVFACVAPGNSDTEFELQLFGFTQSEDVLDTWFSSALWPHSTLGWPAATPELKRYYPTSTLVTSRDIITLWVARMVMTGLYNTGEVPFRHVYIHPKMMDTFGETMSKSRGNGIDPLDIIERYGTDALRYQIVSLAGETQDSRMPVANVCPHCDTFVPLKKENTNPDETKRPKKVTCPNCKKEFRPGGPWTSDDPDRPTAKQASETFETGRNFANKLWNATRFILMNLDGYSAAAVDLKTLPVEDRWILSRLATTAKAVTAALEGYKFSEVARLVYDFAWNEFCDWYIEMSKSRRTDPVCQRVLVGVVDGIVRLIHPVMPFLAESLWHALNAAAPNRGVLKAEAASESVAVAPWPDDLDSLIDDTTEGSIARMQELVRGVREIRNRYILDKTPLELSVKCGEGVAADLNALASFVKQLGGLTSFTCGSTLR